MSESRCCYAGGERQHNQPWEFSLNWSQWSHLNRSDDSDLEVICMTFTCFCYFYSIIKLLCFVLTLNLMKKPKLTMCLWLSTIPLVPTGQRYCTGRRQIKRAPSSPVCSLLKATQNDYKLRYHHFCSNFTCIYGNFSTLSSHLLSLLGHFSAVCDHCGHFFLFKVI